MARSRKPKPGQMGLFTPESDWRPTPLDQLPSWREARRIGIDIETKDPQLKQLGPGVRRGGYITGVSFAIEDGPSFYLPMAHEGGDNLDSEKVLEYLYAQSKVFKGTIVGCHLSYDLDYLWHQGIEFRQAAWHRDIQIAEALIYELHPSYSLDAIARRRELPGKDEQLLREYAASENLDPKSDMWRMPARFVGSYADWDAKLPLLLLRQQEKEIEEQELQQVYDVESRLQLALLRTTARGVRVNEDKLSAIEAWAAKEERDALAEVKRLTGWDVGFGNVWQAKAVAPALQAIGIKLKVTSSGKDSIDKETLERIDHPVAERLLWARKTNKLRTTFAASVRNHLTGGRIHCVYNQLATTGEDEEDDVKGGRFGRLSCEHPNLQQQPARDEFAEMWRDIYEPEPGAMWVCNDFSQQEPRMLTHYAEVADVRGGFEAAQRYRDNPDLDNHVMMAELTQLPRFNAKQIFLGLCYGMGGAKLCRKMNLPTRYIITAGPYKDRQVEYVDSYEETYSVKQRMSEFGNVRCYEVAGEEGQEILDTFNSRAPYVKAMADEAKKRAEARGYIITLLGRRCRFPLREEGGYDWTHKGLNRLIQGGSADQTKKAMVEVDAAGYYLQLQVHDELDSSSATEAEAKRIAQIMIEALPLRVPTKVDTEVGPSWGKVKKI